jgi:serine protease
MTIARPFAAVFLGLAVAGVAGCSATPAADAPVVAALIVRPRAEATEPAAVVQSMRAVLGAEAGLTYVRPLAGGSHLVNLTAPATREQIPALIERLRASGAFQYVEPDSMMKIQ